MIMLIRIMTATVLIAVSILFIDDARAQSSWGFGKNKPVTCYVDERGTEVVLTREVCKLHYQSVATREANETYRTALTELRLEAPPATCSDGEGWCAYQRHVYNEQVARVMAQPNQAMQLVDNREERDHQRSMRRADLFLGWATLGLNTYVALEGTSQRGIGGISFRGDSVRGSAGGGGGSGGGENGAGSGGGSEVGKQGDTYQVYVERGARSQISLGGSSSAGLESYEHAAQNRPVLAEGASLTPTNTDSRERNIGLGELF